MKLQQMFAFVILSMLISVSLFGCVPIQAPTPAADAGEMDSNNIIEATFVCPDGTEIPTVFDNDADTVTVSLPDETITLPRAISGSGARYSDDTTEFWNKGDEATISVNGETIYDGCIAE